MSNEIIQAEKPIDLFGITARAYNVVANTGSGRILNQTMKASRTFTERGKPCRIVAELRFDDNCRNGHETFAITGTIYENGRDVAGGCIHEEIEKHFPELAHLIKWHLCSTDGPMHYVANTMYHADEHGPNRAWVYFTDQDPLRISDKKERLLAYVDADKAKKAEGHPAYRVQWDEKTAKVANFEHARSSAIWPDATVEQLRDKAALTARLPALLDAFKADMIAAGFIYPEQATKEV